MGDVREETVLVTGGSGFVAAHCIIECLHRGYRVRTTVRSLRKKDHVYELLRAGKAANTDKLTFVVADLSKDEGWKEAVDGCTYVLHVASPFPAGVPKDENEVIIPAREGTLRVLRAARDAGVKRVVLTSSMAAICYGHPKTNMTFTEEVWTNADAPGVIAYYKSKTLAERAAWAFIEKEGKSLELSVVNPAVIMGPILGPDLSTSIQLVQRLLNGAIPGCPQLSMGVVDVRDVVDLHLRAMTDPKAKGERFVCVATPAMTVQEMSLALRERLGRAARRAPTHNLPNFLLRPIALFDPDVAMIIPELGSRKAMSNDKAKRLLGWQPRSNVDALVASAESLFEFGLVKK